MEILLTIIHLLACLILVIVVLLQKGKGADLAGAFGGGGSQTALGVRSATQVIHKMTIGAAVFFMLTSYSLSMLQSSANSIAADIEKASEQTESTAPDQPAEQPDDSSNETPDSEPDGTQPDEGGSDEDSSGSEGNESSNESQ